MGYHGDMTCSQNHGFAIEARLRAEFDRYSSRNGIAPPPLHDNYTARFDIPGHLDPYGRGLPSSIKTSKFVGPRTLVYMADAVRVSGLCDVPCMRLLVALYKQQGNQKVFSEVREYLINGHEWKSLMGAVPVEQIEAFSDDIKDPSVSRARELARGWKKTLAGQYPSAMRWNPKIDSSGQRRLQCSVRLEDIEAAIVDKSRIQVFGKATDTTPRPMVLRPVSRFLWQDSKALALPFSLPSPPRARRPRKTPEPATAQPQAAAASGSTRRPRCG